MDSEKTVIYPGLGFADFPPGGILSVAPDHALCYNLNE